MNQEIKPARALWMKKAALFLVSQNISLFGSSVVGFAIVWYITLETSSGFWMMLSTICSTLPQVLVSLFGGVWADRHHRKYLIMLSDGFIALATLLLAVAFWMDLKPMWLLLAASTVRSIGAGIQTPAVSAIYPQIVPIESLTKVQGVNQTLASVLMLLSPAVGGVVLGTFGIVWALLIDVFTAAIAIFVMSMIRVEKQPQADEPLSMAADIRQGISYVFRHRQLRRIVICLLFSFFLITPAAVLSPLMVERTFGDDVWRLTANEIVWTVGSLIGGLFVAWRGTFHNKTRTVAICLVGFGVCFGLLGLSWSFTVFLLFMGIGGFFMPVVSTVQTVHIQEITKPEVLGRVFSIVQLISASAMPVAILLFGPMADVVSVESILLVTGFLLALVGVLYGFICGRGPIEAQPGGEGENR